MDIVFEHNPRKKIPREILDKWIEDRGLRRAEQEAADSEKMVDLAHKENI
jgi:hypothetical protein